MNQPGDQAAITAYLAGKGMPAAGIAGVEGNLQVESGFSPTAYNPKENAHGYAQWEGGRWAGLQSFAKSRGTAPTDSGTQLDFLWSELTSPSYSAVLDQLMQATDPAQAATVFDQQFERSSAASLPARVSAAQAIAAGGVQGGSGQPAGSSSGTAGQGFTATPAGLFSGIFDSVLRPLGKYALDAGLVVMGLIMVIVAAVIVAKGGDSSSSSQPAPAPAPGDDGDQADDEPAPARRGRAAGAAEGGAEDAAVLA